MILAEIVFGLFLLLGIGRGYKAGAVQGIADILSSIIAFLLARWTYGFFAKLIALFAPHANGGIVYFVSFVLLFFTIWKIISMLFGIVVTMLKIVTKLPIISWFNKIFGAVLGFALSVIFVGATAYLVMHTMLDPQLMQWFGSSVVAGYCQKTFMNVLFFLV
ncbi:MAG: CvpA family protein [Candidatus Magasanikbacteria bacterium]|nr:CvpA family protein [Candidatus Magasanikbacteria bacterium]MCA9389370.1 CvpA family protein [Candidatus Magasanikbacteria bacterium]MCA9391432.1 CvpA family protein [Candidatus Magasanikbacteria bacterium]